MANDVRDIHYDLFNVCLLLILYSFGLACCAIEMMHMATGELKCYLWIKTVFINIIKFNSSL